MENTTGSPQVKYKWLSYVWATVVVLLLNFLSWKFDWSLLSHILLMISIVIVVPYLLHTGPKKRPFLNYAGILLAFFGFALAVVWGGATLLRPYILFGYAVGLMWVVLWQGLYWYVYWKESTARNLRAFTTFLLLGLLPAASMAWMQYRTQSLLKELTGGRIPVSIQSTEVTK